jgi:hypothetical protein
MIIFLIRIVLLHVLSMGSVNLLAAKGCDWRHGSDALP